MSIDAQLIDRGRLVTERDRAYAAMRRMVPALAYRAVTAAEVSAEQQAAIDRYHDIAARVILSCHPPVMSSRCLSEFLATVRSRRRRPAVRPDDACPGGRGMCLPGNRRVRSNNSRHIGG